MVDQLVEAAAAGHAGTLSTLTQTGIALGAAVDILIGVVNPHAVVLGGFLGPLGEYVLPSLNERIASRLELEGYAGTSIVAVDQAVPRAVGGAILAARDACFYDPLALTRPVR